MSVHKIKTGKTIPTSEDLIDRQIGYDCCHKNLYINVNGRIDTIGGEGTNKKLQEQINSLSGLLETIIKRNNLKDNEYDI
jgi:hypothetical protein